MQHRRRSLLPRTSPPPAADRTRREKGRPGWLGFFRKLFWTWCLWLVVGVSVQAGDHGNAAVVFASVALICYLVAPRQHTPRYALDSTIAVHSHELLTSIVGASGVPFLHNDKATALNKAE